ncbi:hypothetical protein N8Z10_00720 [bacterium]|nr:hypothetical protein [bacterium]
MEYTYLESVDSFMDNDGTVYPSYDMKTLDLNSPMVANGDVSFIELIGRLSEEDFNIIKPLIDNKIWN